MRPCVACALLASALFLLVASSCRQQHAPSKRPTSAPSVSKPTSLPEALRKRYPQRDLAVFQGYTIGQLPLFLVTGRGNARCKPSWVVGLEDGKLLVGRDLFLRARALEATAPALRLARLTLDVLLQQQGRAVLSPAELERRCPGAPQGAGCLPAERPLIHDPKIEGDQLTFWRTPCYGPGADRVRMAIAAADYLVVEARTLLSDAHKKRDPVGWVRKMLAENTHAGPQREALKALSDCRWPGSREVLLELAARSPHSIVREKAIGTLARCRHADTTKALLRVAVDDQHPNVRQAAVDVLGTLADPRALPLLRRLARHERETSVRYAAKRALERWASATAANKKRVHRRP